MQFYRKLHNFSYATILKIIFRNDNEFNLSIRANFFKLVKIIHNPLLFYNCSYNESSWFIVVSLGFRSLLFTIFLCIIFINPVFLCIDNVIDVV